MTIIEIARTQIGVQEKPKGTNKGKEVEQYLASVGIYTRSSGIGVKVAANAPGQPYFARSF